MRIQDIVRRLVGYYRIKDDRLVEAGLRTLSNALAERDAREPDLAPSPEAREAALALPAIRPQRRAA